MWLQTFGLIKKLITDHRIKKISTLDIPTYIGLIEDSVAIISPLLEKASFPCFIDIPFFIKNPGSGDEMTLCELNNKNEISGFSELSKVQGVFGHHWPFNPPWKRYKLETPMFKEGSSEHFWGYTRKKEWAIIHCKHFITYKKTFENHVSVKLTTHTLQELLHYGVTGDYESAKNKEIILTRAKRIRNQLITAVKDITETAAKSLEQRSQVLSLLMIQDALLLQSGEKSEIISNLHIGSKYEFFGQK